MLIDIHSHLDIIKNLDKVLERAKKSKIGIILACGINKKTNRKVLELTCKYKEVKACVGIYPNEALKMSKEEINNELDFIKENRDKIIAIGEVGLDFLEDGKDTFEKQKQILIKQILLAKELNKPVIIHSRKAESEIIELLENLNYKKIIMHCFNGKLKLVKKIINNKWYLSIPTNVKHSEHFQKIIEVTPIEQLFCETDSPFLHPDKEKWNEPANVIESYKKIAEIKCLKLEEVEKQIEKNYNQIFNK